MRKSHGFTIIELVVVVSVIAILTGLVALGVIRYQALGRDSERAASAQIIAEALEKYFDKNGEYPPCTALTGNAADVTTNALRGLDKAVLVAPQEDDGVTNSIRCTDLTSASQPDFFAYVGDNSDNCQTGDACLFFSLKYKKEADNEIGVIQSRRNTSIATSGTPTLTTTATGFAEANLSWTAIKNSSSYTLQRATDSAFTQNFASQELTGVNTSLTGLSYNTTYYFRVRANSTMGAGQWSTVKTMTTWSIGTPTITASTVSSTSFRGSWGSTSRATGYVAQCSSDGSTWGTGCQTGTLTATSYTFTGAAQGARYYVRVKAVNGAYSSNWSNAPSTITTIDAPAAYNMNTIQAWDAAHFNWLRGSANLASCPAGTTPVYHWYHNVNGSNTFWVGGPQYQIVDHALSWWDSVTITVATRCETANTVSGWTWANGGASMYLQGPTVSAWLQSYRTAAWGGSCPNYSTDHNYYWRILSEGTANGASGGPTKAQSWNGTAYTWGDGNIRATLHCYGPWGTVGADSAPGPFGSGCSPTATKAICTQ